MTDPGKNKWFGKTPFGPMCHALEKVKTPTGQKCQHCDEPIEEGDEGVIMPSCHQENGQWVACWVPTHRECLLRQVIGSVGHQMKKCHCYGGTEEDPPELTKRQAAIMACELLRGA